MKRKKYTQKDFAWVEWTGPQMKSALERELALLKEQYKKVKSIPADERTFENTVLGIEQAGQGLSDTINYISVLQNASPKEDVRKAASKIITATEHKLVEIEYDPKLYEALKEYAPKKEKLSGSDKILFDDMMKGYARMGFDLPKEKQNELKRLSKELGTLANDFDTNLNEYEDEILVTRAELDGLPETYIANLSKKGEKYAVTLAYPESGPFMASAHDEALRKKLLDKLMQKGGAKNVAIMEKLLRIRAQISEILGYKNYVDYQTELRTAKSEKNVRAFLSGLMKRVQKKGLEELELLAKHKKKLTGNSKAELAQHDIGYLFKQLIKEKFDLDADLLKEYFPFQHVRTATLDIYAELFGVVFKQKKMTLWHQDVEFFEIQDKKGNLIAYFALDLYPRKGKFGHAAVFDGVYGRKDGDTYITPFCTMMTNFPKPSKVNPSLMSHGEVETFFHEFGHLMHFTLTKAEYFSQSGFHVAWDFVEAPSQMLENWVWDKKMLKRLSKHYKTNQSLPDLLINRLIKTRLFGEAHGTVRQLILGLYDLEIHTKKQVNLNSTYARMLKSFTKISPPKNQRFIAGFGHMAHGYAAGYYGYMWSKVYAQDMFSRFEKEGVMNKKAGADYRKLILEKGSSEEELKLVEQFLGRKPNNKAFLRSLGISAKK